MFSCEFLSLYWSSSPHPDTWECSLITAANSLEDGFPDQGWHSAAASKPWTYPFPLSHHRGMRSPEKSENSPVQPVAHVNWAPMEYCLCPSQKYFIAEIQIWCSSSPLFPFLWLHSKLLLQSSWDHVSLQGAMMYATSGPNHQKGLWFPHALCSLSKDMVLHVPKGRVDTNEKPRFPKTPYRQEQPWGKTVSKGLT